MLCGVLFALLLAAACSAGAQVCNFRTPPGTMNFPPLDPSVATTQTVVSTVIVRCTASGSPTWQFSGANGNAPLRMKHATLSAFIPYTMTATFVSPGGGNQNWSLTATVLGQDYQNAQVGSYSDLLTVTIIP
jgi:spore coat protein U-like protein